MCISHPVTVTTVSERNICRRRVAYFVSWFQSTAETAEEGEYLLTSLQIREQPGRPGVIFTQLPFQIKTELCKTGDPAF